MKKKMKKKKEQRIYDPSLILVLTFLAYVGLAILMLFLWIVSVMFSDGYIDGIETVIPEYESPENIPLPKQTE